MQWFHEIELEVSDTNAVNAYENVSAKTDYISELIGHGEQLIARAMVQKENNIRKIQDDISKIRRREKALLRIVNNSKTLLREKSQQEEEDESKIMSSWQIQSREISD